MSIIYYENEFNREFDIGTDTKELCKMLLDKALDYLKCEYEAECSLLITDGETIREYNRENRNIDSQTDVLSFPAIDFVTPCGYDILDENDFTQFNPDTGMLMLGDIVVSVEKVIEQAEKYGHTPTRELAFLVAHSMMHLFGYDHMTEEESSVMEAKQRAVLDNLGITR